MLKQLIVTVLVAIIVSFGVVSVTPSASEPNFAGVTHLSGLQVGDDGFSVVDGGSFQVGANGSSIRTMRVGTCYIKAYSTTIAASSTATVDCQGTAAVSASGISALTGVVSTSTVVTTLSTTTAGTTFMGLHIAGAKASTTAGYITMIISNLTGATYTWPVTGSASGTASFISAQ